MNWFKNWFDSPYYHLLYKHRDQIEANYFLDNLIQKLKPDPQSFFLDLGCGNGRHAKYLNKHGFKVDGVDLSKESLKKAIKHQNENLCFYHRDMREYIEKNKYDFIINLFTSFGYFENEQDNFKIFQNISQSLKSHGYIIIDFFNSKKIVKNLVAKETKIINDIVFNITKSHDNKFVYKEIVIHDRENKYTFTEKVRLFKKKDFIFLTKGLNLQLTETYGDYKLNYFNPIKSDRLILIFKKTT